MVSKRYFAKNKKIFSMLDDITLSTFLFTNVLRLFYRQRINGLFRWTLLQHLSDNADSDWFVALSNIDCYASAISVLPWRILFHSFVPSISRSFSSYTQPFVIFLLRKYDIFLYLCVAVHNFFDNDMQLGIYFQRTFIYFYYHVICCKL